MKKLKEYIGKEIFIACSSGAYIDHDIEPGEIGVFESISDLNEYLCEMTPDTGEEAVACHGILMSATYIPDNCLDIVSHIILQDPGSNDIGCVIDGCQLDDDGKEKGTELLKFVEKTVAGSISEQFDGLDIEDVFFLCGYPLMLSYLVQEEEVDEEKLKDVGGRTKSACEAGKEILEG